MKCSMKAGVKVLLGFAMTIGVGNVAWAQAPSSGVERDLFSNPCSFPEELTGEHGYIAVPENRSKADSRKILVHYMRFFSRADRPSKSPVFVLPAGPGESYSEARINRDYREDGRYNKVREIIEYTKTRDVVIVNQRGNTSAPGLWSREMVVFAKPGELGAAYPQSLRRKNLSDGFRQSIKRWSSAGIDLSGYGIASLVNDVEDVRVSLGYDKICLRGASFGSQESLVYMTCFPANVERAMLHGVEPVDFEYDSADGIWAALERIEVAVKADTEFVLPKPGLLGAIKEIIERLEKSPVKVEGVHPKRDLKRDVVIDADDFRSYIRDCGMGRSPREDVAYLPKFVKEIYDGDYRLLASRIVDDRPESYEGAMLSFLINGSLGISSERKQILDAEPAKRWLGDLGWRTDAVEPLVPAPKLESKFQKLKSLNIPVLLIQGDLDFSTPFENAVEQQKYLPKSHLIRIKGGTHATTYDAVEANPDFPQFMYDFMNCEIEETELEKFFATLPVEVEMPPIKFNSGSLSLFEELRARGSGQ